MPSISSTFQQFRFFQTLINLGLLDDIQERVRERRRKLVRVSKDVNNTFKHDPIHECLSHIRFSLVMVVVLQNSNLKTKTNMTLIV